MNNETAEIHGASPAHKVINFLRALEISGHKLPPSIEGKEIRRVMDLLEQRGISVPLKNMSDTEQRNLTENLRKNLHLIRFISSEEISQDLRLLKLKHENQKRKMNLR